MKTLISVLMLALSATCMAQWNTDALLMELSPASEQSIMNVKSVVTPQGRTWVSYTTTTSSYLVDGRLQLLDTDGTPLFSDPISVIPNNRNLGSMCESYGLTCDDDGNAVVCFPSAKGTESYMPFPRLFKFSSEGASLWGVDGVGLPIESENICGQGIYNFGGAIYAIWKYYDDSWTVHTTITKINDNGEPAWGTPFDAIGHMDFKAMGNDLVGFSVVNGKAEMTLIGPEGNILRTEVLSEEGAYVNAPWGMSGISLASSSVNVAFSFSCVSDSGDDELMFGFIGKDGINSTAMSCSHPYENIVVGINDDGTSMSVLCVENDWTEGASLHQIIYDGFTTGSFIITSAPTVNSLFTSYAPDGNLFSLWTEADSWNGCDVWCGNFTLDGIANAKTELLFTGEASVSVEISDDYAYVYMPYYDIETYLSALVGMRVPLSGSLATNSVSESRWQTCDDVEYYDLKGMRIKDNSCKGIFIESSKNGSRKVRR